MLLIVPVKDCRYRQSHCVEGVVSLLQIIKQGAADRREVQQAVLSRLLPGKAPGLETTSKLESAASDSFGQLLRDNQIIACYHYIRVQDLPPDDEIAHCAAHKIRSRIQFVQVARNLLQGLHAEAVFHFGLPSSAGLT